MADPLRLCVADYANAAHAHALVFLLDAYARDPMGGAQGLSEYARSHLVAELARRPYAFSVLAFAGDGDAAPVGLANCMEGFSTFACRPLVNVHDLAVLPTYRGQGVGARLLDKVGEVARRRGACKLTLEVLSGNQTAQRLYVRAGFAQYALTEQAGLAQFWQKWLD
jgi:ribosomal protein S18 acetylase RimI-like enzyme